ncbi:MAG TPA: hypothetical protein VGK89_04195 [Candidatus Eisenbacteria bacterium]|jgi:hypothetical protein
MRALTIALVVAGLSNPLPNLIAQFKQATKPKPPVPAAGRLVLFVGLDISGSFMNGRYFDDSIHFLARYLHGHLHGYGGMEPLHSLFVGSIGGEKKDEPKTLYPIQTFEDRSIDQIEAELRKIFPKNKVNKFTDYNSFFEQVADMVDTRKLILKPLAIVLLTDGVPDVGGNSREEKFRNLRLKPLEGLSRNITLRVLYTDAVTAKCWRDEVPRRRIKVWTQDAVVMDNWKSPRILSPAKAPEQQDKYFAWIRDNVDFYPRLRPVD